MEQRCNINLPYVPRAPTIEEKANPRYCDFHRSVGHLFAECRNLRRIFHQRMEAKELVIGNERFQNNPLPAHQMARGHVNVIVHVGQDEPSSSNKEFEDMHADVSQLQMHNSIK